MGLAPEFVDQNRLMRSIQQSKFEEVLAEKKSQLSTMVGEGGARLSGGQQQRLALARAYYFRKDVYIFDETTSALDETTEREVFDEINRLRGLHTIVLISHNKEIMNFCDKVINLDDLD